MSNTITRLYNGELDTLPYLAMERPELRHLEQLIERNCEKLELHLCERAKKILETYCTCVNEYITLSNEQAFYHGFCLGTKLAAEALTEPMAR